MKYLPTVLFSYLYFASLNAQIPPTVTYPGVYVQEVPSGGHVINSFPTSTAVFIGYTQQNIGGLNKINSFSEYEGKFGAKKEKFFMYESIELFFENGGNECFVVSVGGFGTKPDRKDLMSGLKESKKLDAQIVVVPDAVQLSPEGFYFVQNKTLETCNSLGDRFAVLNTFLPTGETAQFIQNFRNQINSSNLKSGAVYFPWLINFDNKAVPPAGAIAGIYARTDGSDNVWKAPAGLEANITGITALSRSVTDAEQERLNVSLDGKSINALRFFPNYGNLVWGSRTLAGNDNDLRYISIRRTMIMLENSIKGSLSWVVFEPNNEPLWKQVKISLNNYLSDLWKEGALQGSNPKEAFFVKCGLRETMSQNDIDEGNLIVTVGVASVMPAEFVILNFEIPLQD